MNERAKIEMGIDWDVPIAMDDGIVLRADVFRPPAAARFPVLLSYGPYGKGLSFQEGYSTAWQLLVRDHPDAVRGSSNRYQNWEVCDPEKWVPDGYVIVRVDSRGAGRSPGEIDHHSPREIEDICACIEWAAQQPWSDGKVGLAGISYYAVNQWRVAAMAPPHLAAVCIWEGYYDRYRDAARHGGILCSFTKNWQEMQVQTVQHGRGERGPKSAVTGELVCGPETLPEQELAGKRAPIWQELSKRVLVDDYYRERTADTARITLPLLSCANWGGQGLHLRGNVEGYLAAASTQKWLEIHGGAHWAEFYTDAGIRLQKRFFGHFLKGEGAGWDRQPPVTLQVRHLDRFVERAEREWPLARTHWTRFYLDLDNRALVRSEPAAASQMTYDASGDGVDFRTGPLDAPVEITGPSAAKLFVSSATADADLFLVVRVFAPDGEEVVFRGAVDPHTPIAQGWLRASHRKIDPARSQPWRPFHPHDELKPLVPGEVAELDVEIWPTSIVVPAGYSIGLSVRGRDYEWEGAAATLSNMKNPMKGCGPFTHEEPEDRPAAIFGGKVTLHARAGAAPYLLLPIIPEQDGGNA
ncbi:MAG: CocE/NonD family hydrolase [Xanthobacteraceae bacterium]